MAAPQTTIRCFSPEILGRAEPSEAVRGVGWVLQWAAAAVVLCVAAVVLLNFAYRLAAEQALARAAAAGLREAALPRATGRSVEQSIRRELGGVFRLGSDTQIRLQCGGKLVRGVITGKAGDQLSVSLAVPVAAAMPEWLQMLSPWNEHAQMVSQVGRAI